jgi:hypothetical protein
VILCLAVAAFGQTAKHRPRAKAKVKAPAVQEPVLIAEGRYQMNGGAAVGFEEPWTLFKTRLGYELTEQWVLPPRGVGGPQVIDLKVQMVGELRPVQVHIGDALQGLTCKIALDVFRCESRGRTTELPMQGPYDFFSPSPWMLGNIVRRAQRVKGERSTIQLVRIEGTGADGVRISSLVASVGYVGDDQLEVAGAKQAVSIYELKSEGKIPDMLVWISPEGLVYAIQDSSHPEQRLDLVELKRHGRM